MQTVLLWLIHLLHYLSQFHIDCWGHGIDEQSELTSFTLTRYWPFALTPSSLNGSVSFSHTVEPGWTPSTALIPSSVKIRWINVFFLVSVHCWMWQMTQICLRTVQEMLSHCSGSVDREHLDYQVFRMTLKYFSLLTPYNSIVLWWMVKGKCMFYKSMRENVNIYVDRNIFKEAKYC